MSGHEVTANNRGKGYELGECENCGLPCKPEDRLCVFCAPPKQIKTPKQKLMACSFVALREVPSPARNVTVVTLGDANKVAYSIVEKIKERINGYKLSIAMDERFVEDMKKMGKTWDGDDDDWDVQQVRQIQAVIRVDQKIIGELERILQILGVDQ